MCPSYMPYMRKKSLGSSPRAAGATYGLERGVTAVHAIHAVHADQGAAARGADRREQCVTAVQAVPMYRTS